MRVVPLTGDASTRQYFRILRPDNPSVVLAVYDAPFVFDELPFVNVCRLFTNIPLPIPAIAGHADDPSAVAVGCRVRRSPAAFEVLDLLLSAVREVQVFFWSA